MDPIKRALASWTGFDEQFEAQNKELASTKMALEETLSVASQLERIVDEYDYINLFDPTQTLEQDIIPSAKRAQVINRLRRMRHENPIAKQAVRLAVRFTFGRGISYIIKDENKHRIVNAFWNDPTNLAILTSHRSMKQRFDETLTDGENFFLGFEDSSPPYLRLTTIPMEQIVDIIYDPNNRNVPIYYKRSFVEYKYDSAAYGGVGAYVPKNPDAKPTIKFYRDYRITEAYLAQVDDLSIREGDIAEGKIKHRSINEVQMKSGKRGVSELFASREWFRVFKEFMEDRGAINAAANAFSYLRQSKGGPAAVAKMTGQIGGLDVTPDESTTSPALRRLTRPVAAAIYDTNENVQLKPIRADTGAVHAKEDARLLLMAGGAGVATNIHYFGEGGDANLATAQAMELPMVKGYEDWQQMHEEEFDDFAQWVNRIAEGDDEAERIEIAWDFPPIIAQDVVKYTTAYAQLTQQIAPKNRKVKEIAIRGGLISLDVPNVDEVMDEIIEEEDRLFEEQEEQKQFQQDLQLSGQQNPPQPGGFPPKNGNGTKPAGQKATDGGSVPALGPDLQRIANGRPPRDVARGPRTKR